MNMVWEDELVLEFHHPYPLSEIHLVVIPKKHIPSILEAVALDREILTSMLRAIQVCAKNLGLNQTGFYLRANAAGPGVTPHMHWHVLGPGIP